MNVRIAYLLDPLTVVPGVSCHVLFEMIWNNWLIRITDGFGANPLCFIYSLWISFGRTSHMKYTVVPGVACHLLFEMIYCPRHRKVTSQSYIPYHQIHQHCNDKTDICHEQSQSLWFLKDLLILREYYSTSLHIPVSIESNGNDPSIDPSSIRPIDNRGYLSALTPKNTCVGDDKIFLRGGERLNKSITTIYLKDVELSK